MDKVKNEFKKHIRSLPEIFFEKSFQLIFFLKLVLFTIFIFSKLYDRLTEDISLFPSDSNLLFCSHSICLRSD